MRENALSRNGRRISLIAAAGVLAVAIVACGFQAPSSDAAEIAGAKAAGATAIASAAADSSALEVVDISASPDASGGLVAMHETLGVDISSITDISYDTCGTCHGDYQTIRARTEAIWPGIGQISDANPHTAHASNSLACSDCHSLTSEQVNVCNQCHDFEDPSGWVDMDSTTTAYGLTNTTKPTFRTTQVGSSSSVALSLIHISEPTRH